ncbi:hypothetical protein [Lacrimispora amygdalina]|uniref:hypothetical protein n=1 Tax=Lacrimispora amygdalina TaxID=253257 RepID=UPI0014781784|nr:hypothetical protein [Clostridium indicum]
MEFMDSEKRYRRETGIITKENIIPAIGTAINTPLIFLDFLVRKTSALKNAKDNPIEARPSLS